MAQAEIKSELSSWSRRILLGPDDAWAARVATSPMAIYTLAALVLVAHVLDLATGLHMMTHYGIDLEQNPLARYVMATAGPMGLVPLKLGVVGGGVLLFVRAAQLGRARLARNCLLFSAAVGLLGIASNMVG
jgi:uncharacterized membrane protein